MSTINVKLLSEDALNFMKKNIDTIFVRIQENDTNDWIYSEFPQNIFVTKKYEIEDFCLKNNPDSIDKKIDLENSINIYENLKSLPRYILTDERFWLWLYLDKFYLIVKNMMSIKGTVTITDHWMHKQGTRRGLMFGVLSRCFFRVELTVDNSLEDEFELTRWIIEKPERFRNLSWRSFSSEEHLVRGILRGEMKAVEEYEQKESPELYTEIAKQVSIIGGVRLLDAISEEDISKMIYEYTAEFLSRSKN